MCFSPSIGDRATSSSYRGGAQLLPSRSRIAPLQPRGLRRCDRATDNAIWSVPGAWCWKSNIIHEEIRIFRCFLCGEEWSSSNSEVYTGLFCGKEHSFPQRNIELWGDHSSGWSESVAPHHARERIHGLAIGIFSKLWLGMNPYNRETVKP